MFMVSAAATAAAAASAAACRDDAARKSRPPAFHVTLLLDLPVRQATARFFSRRGKKFVMRTLASKRLVERRHSPDSRKDVIAAPDLV